MAKSRPPEEVLRRVLRTSRKNGWSVAIFAVLSFFISLFTGGVLGLGMGVFIIVGGVMEIMGYRRLRRRDRDGMKLLVNSQLVVLGAVWAWALPSLLSFDAGYLREQVIPNVRQTLAAGGMNLDSFLGQAGLSVNQIVPLVHLFFVVLYGSIMLATLIYQGGMAWYYHRQRAAVETALKALPVVRLPVAASLPTTADVEAPPALTPRTPLQPAFSGADQRCFDLVAEEMARNDLKPGLWARALAEAGADDGRARAFYIRFRVAEMLREVDTPPPA